METRMPPSFSTAQEPSPEGPQPTRYDRQAPLRRLAQPVVAMFPVIPRREAVDFLRDFYNDVRM